MSTFLQGIGPYIELYFARLTCDKKLCLYESHVNVRLPTKVVSQARLFF